MRFQINPPKIFNFFIFLICFLTANFLSVVAFAHSPGEHKHDLENIPAKPDGMIEFQKDQTPGSEYMQEDSPEMSGMDHGDHSRLMDPNNSEEDNFRIRGTHELMGDSLGRKNVIPGKALLARGRAIYMHMCVFCHGKDGNGGGPAMDFLYPWPRDFRNGIFKFRSTPTGTLPRDEDIYRTIIRGIPGTSMPNWSAALSPEDTWALVNVIKNFSPRFRNEPPGNSISLESIPESTAESIKRGKELYTVNKCMDCHGTDGKGGGKLAESLMDAWKHAVFVHDITNLVHIKGGSSPKDIYRTISTGLDGTPMESYAHLSDKDRWDLTHYVRSRFSKKKVKKAEFETDVYSKKVMGKIDTDPTNPVWNNIPSTNLVLRPLSARRGAVETINFSSIHNEEDLAVRLRWEDPFLDQDQTLGDQYLDQAAVQFALGAVTLHTHGHNEPFWGMGNRGKPVNIWHWKAGGDRDFAGITEKGNVSALGGDVDMDALIFGGTSPIAALRSQGKRSVTELNAEGFSTLTPQPEDKQNVSAKGSWDNGVWTVVFTREMEKTGRWDADFFQKDPVLIGFAIWDGLKEDRNGRKVVSVWQRLNIEGVSQKSDAKKGMAGGGHHNH